VHTWILLSPPPLHVAMVHQPWPSYENSSSSMQRKPFLRASAPQIGCLRPRKCQWWLSFPFSVCLNIHHHIWHSTIVSLANTYIRHHLSVLLAWRVITSYCCCCIYHMCNPCRETLSPQTCSQRKCPFRHTKGGLNQKVSILGD